MSPTPEEKARRLATEAEGYYELELHEDALQRVEQIVDDERFSTFAASMRAECLRSLGQFAEGAEAFEKLIALQPDNVAAYVGLGWCHKRDGRLDLALELMERLLEAVPGEGIGLYNLSCYCAIDGQRERALELLAEAIEVEEEFCALAREEPDYDALRDDPEFQSLTGEETP